MVVVAAMFNFAQYLCADEAVKRAVAAIGMSETTMAEMGRRGGVDGERLAVKVQAARIATGESSLQ